jgi:hypothetical protein
VPDHSGLSKTRSRLPQEVHEEVFGWVLALIAEHGLVDGERIGVDASTMEECRAPDDRGRETVDAEADGRGERDRDAVFRRSRSHRRQDRQDEGRHHLAYKPEHAVDLDTGAVVAAEIHPADEDDTTTMLCVRYLAMGFHHPKAAGPEFRASDLFGPRGGIGGAEFVFVPAVADLAGYRWALWNTIS